MGHMTLLRGIVVLLGLPLLLQHLCQDLQRARMPPGGPLGSAGIVGNEVHTQAWGLQDMASIMKQTALCGAPESLPHCPVPTHPLTLALGPGGVSWGLGTRGGGSPGPQREWARRKWAGSVPEAGPGSWRPRQSRGGVSQAEVRVSSHKTMPLSLLPFGIFITSPLNLASFLLNKYFLHISI